MGISPINKFGLPGVCLPHDSAQVSERTGGIQTGDDTAGMDLTADRDEKKRLEEIMDKLIEGVVIENCGEIAKVRCSIHSDCDNCGFCPGSNAMILDVVDEVGAQIGQTVLVENKETNMLRAAFIVYMLPLLAIGLGVGLGYYLSVWLKISANLGMILGGVGLAVPALYIVKRLDRSMQSEKPIIVRTIK